MDALAIVAFPVGAMGFIFGMMAFLQSNKCAKRLEAIESKLENNP